MICEEFIGISDFLDALITYFVFFLLRPDRFETLSTNDFIYRVLPDGIHLCAPSPNIFITPIRSHVEVYHLLTKRMSLKGIEIKALFPKFLLE